MHELALEMLIRCLLANMTQTCTTFQMLRSWQYLSANWEAMLEFKGLKENSDIILTRRHAVPNLYSFVLWNTKEGF